MFQNMHLIFGENRRFSPYCTHPCSVSVFFFPVERWNFSCGRRRKLKFSLNVLHNICQDDFFLFCEIRPRCRIRAEKRRLFDPQYGQNQSTWNFSCGHRRKLKFSLNVLHYICQDCFFLFCEIRPRCRIRAKNRRIAGLSTYKRGFGETRCHS